MSDEEKEWPRCVFGCGGCLVRHEMRQGRMLRVVEPKELEARMAKKVAEALTSTLSVEWAALSSFCRICPKWMRRGEEPPKTVLVKRGVVPPPEVPVGPPVATKLMILGHDVVLERRPEAKQLADFVQKFTKLDRASKDVLIFNINRLSLWKAAEKHTADEVIEFLKRYAKTPPSDSLKRWIARTMSMWDSLRIKSEKTYDFLEAADEKLMDRILSMREVKQHIFRRLEPTKARVIEEHRGDLKQVLIDKGYPIKDMGRYEEFKPLQFDLKVEELKRDPLHRWEAYQKDAVEDFLRYGSGTIILPGGSGKTVIAVAAAAKLKAPTLVLATRSEIVKQFYEEFLTKTTISPDQVKYIDADVRKRSLKPITICTYQIARSLPALWKVKWGLIVYDESQHIPAPIWSKTTGLQTTRRLGLTATPVREDKHEKLIFSLIGPACFEKGWMEMAEEGFIARAKAFEVLVDMSSKIARRYSHSTDEREKYILASTNPGKLPVIKKLLERHKEDPVLIIGYYVQGALEIGKKFGVPVCWGEMPPKKRHKLYDGFRRGEIDKLVLTSVGEEGIDLPNAKVLIEVCGLYGSRMQMGQRFSRILRPKDEEAVFYELVSRGTSEQDFSEKRRQFLIAKGYEFEEYNEEKRR